MLVGRATKHKSSSRGATPRKFCRSYGAQRTFSPPPATNMPLLRSWDQETRQPRSTRRLDRLDRLARLARLAGLQNLNFTPSWIRRASNADVKPSGVLGPTPSMPRTLSMVGNVLPTVLLTDA